MNRTGRLVVLCSALLVVGCAHQINITPPLTSLKTSDIRKVQKHAAYYISADDRAKEVTTPGGGGDKVKYFPYKEIEPALVAALQTIFNEVSAIPSLDDKQSIASKKIAFIFVPKVATDSSS